VAFFFHVTEIKLEKLRTLLRGYESCLIAYSGGVDSVFLALVGHQVLKERCLAVIADSPSLPRKELEEALELGRKFNFPVHVIATQEFSNDAYLANPHNRCYFCKQALFSEMLPLARKLNFSTIAYGENASDAGDFRPGSLAAQEFDIHAPLKEAGLSKSEIRQLSAELGLPTADKPQMACLSSRIPHGEVVTEEKLRMIEVAEVFLRNEGFYDLRVRHHEMKSGALARIELGPGEISSLLGRQETMERIVAGLKQLGYLFVTVDLLGYRRGTLEQTIEFSRRKS